MFAVYPAYLAVENKGGASVNMRIERRCSFCLAPCDQQVFSVLVEADEFCSDSCKRLSDDYYEEHVVYPKVDDAA